MGLLRGTLRWQAVLWALSGLLLVVAPAWVVESAMGQPPLGEDAWLRAAGVMAIALAAQMALVLRRIEDLWWWMWTFALLEVGIALALVVPGVLGLPDGAPAWPWMALGAVNLAFAAADVLGLARAGTERSPA